MEKPSCLDRRSGWSSAGHWILVALGFALGGALLPQSANGQISTDGSMGPAQVLMGPDFDIDASLGTQLGENLFHSFQDFNIHTGESATFTGPSSIDNVISRVTGGTASNIDGLLRSEIAGADVFLVNPAGILFGPNASLDVDGSFHATTAGQVLFPDGGVFDATNPGATILSVAPPSAFGFLDNNPAALLVDRSELSVPKGQALSIVGGDITVTNADLLAPGGRLELTSVAGPGSVPIESAAFDTSSFARLGTISVLDDSLVDVSDPVGASALFLQGDLSSVDLSDAGPAGALFIRGGDLVVDNSAVLSVNLGTGKGQNVAVDLSGNLTITDGILATFGTGDSADMTIRAGSLTIADSGSIDAFAFGSGGDLVIAVTGDITLTGRSSNTRSRISSGGVDGDAGDATISAATLSVSDGARLLKFGNGLGDAGSLTIDVGTLTLTDGGRIRKDVDGDGRGARVTITASDVITMGGRDPVSGQPSGIFSESGTTQDPGSLTIIAPIVEVGQGSNISQAAFGLGSGSDLVMTVDRLVVSDGARVRSNNRGSGQSGSIKIDARELIRVSGRSDLAGRGSISTETFGPGSGGDIFITSPLIQVQNSALIVADTFADGPAGNVNIKVGQLQLTEGGIISSTANNRPGQFGFPGTGDGGRISIVADDITIVGGLGTDGRIAGIFGNSLSPGTGASIEIEADSITISDGGLITSGARDLGNGGQIQISLTEDLDISGRGITGQRSAITSETRADGDGGTITISARQVRISDGARVVADSSGSGKAGSIKVSADVLQLTNDAQISTQSIVSDGGNLDVDVAQLVLLRDSQITTSVGTGSGAGGNIVIDPIFVVLDSSTIQANAFGGPGGNITIVADNFLASPDSLVEASSVLGIDGTVSIGAPETDVSSGLTVLAGNLMDAAARLAKQCGARGGRTLASFVGKGRGALPMRPGAAMMAHYLGATTAKLGAAPGQGSVQRAANKSRSGAHLVPGTLELTCLE